MKNLSRLTTYIRVPFLGFFLNTNICAFLVLTSGSLFPILGFVFIHFGMVIVTRKSVQ